jgi:RNA polymerase primary sigma factor
VSDDEYVDDPVRVYLREVCNIPPLSRDEEIESERLLRTGDEKAGLRLTEANLAMVVGIAQRYGNGTVHVLDLIIEGNNALQRVLKSFSETSGSFSEHAAAHVERAIAEAAAVEPPNAT